MLMLLGASSDKGVLFEEDANDSSGYLVVNDDLVVLADCVNAVFLTNDDKFKYVCGGVRV